MNKCNYDVAVIGAGFSGLAATLFLGNSNRTVLLCDNDQPTRNYQAHTTYNFVAYDKSSPKEMIQKTNIQINQFDHINRVKSDIKNITKCEKNDNFKISFNNNHAIVKRVILATGVKDIIPNIKGTDELWPYNIFNCPYCIAYELKNKPLAIYSPNQNAYMMAKIIHKWTDDLILFTENKAQFTQQQIIDLKNIGISVNNQKITSFSGKQNEFINIHTEENAIINRCGIFA